jgi:RNA polymerase sigma-70 factor, ECF subfamily
VERFDAWLHRILMNAAAEEFRRRRRHEAVVREIPVEPTATDDAHRIDDRDELERGFQGLSLDHRAVVVLHQYLGLPMPEVAATLGIRVGTAKSRYHYAISAMRAALEAEARLVRQEATA